MKTKNMSTRIKLILFVVSFIVHSLSMGQKEKNVWYFGYGAGIDFSKGKPYPIGVGNVSTLEGNATICDKRGKLLFYTDGVKVWNREHKVMYNGDGLSGHNSSTQSAIIVPKPGDSKQYYIFTVGKQAESPGFAYSMVDMNRSNGKGSVTVKSKVLLSKASEKVAAVNHCNGEDIWVVTHEWNSNKFYSYLITKNGVQKPVISSIGNIHQDVVSGNMGEAIGYMRISPNGKKLASVMSKINKDNIEIFDFNNENGQLSNRKSISKGNSAYGVCFSPDNSKLYVSFDNGSDGVIQVDLTSPNIQSSILTLRPRGNVKYGALQIGPNGKIYISTGKPFLDVINRPNKKGALCDYQFKGLSLGKKYSGYGLPEYLVQLNDQNSSGVKILGNDTVVCAKSAVLESKITADRYTWSTGEKTKSIQVKKSGKYWLKASSKGCGQFFVDTISVKFGDAFKVDLGNDTSLTCSQGLVLDAGVGGALYKWSTGATTKEITVAKSATYEVSVTKYKCTVTDAIRVDFLQRPAVFSCLKSISPNGDGLNDKFDYIIRDVTSFSLRIMNKKKKVVFKTKDPKEKWNGKFKGKVVPDGTYFWEAKYKSECWEQLVTKTGEVEVKK